MHIADFILSNSCDYIIESKLPSVHLYNSYSTDNFIHDLHSLICHLCSIQSIKNINNVNATNEKKF